MKKIIPIVSSLLLFFSMTSVCQTESKIYFKGAVKEKRTILYRNILQNTITKNLSLSLSDYTEENWIAAFGGMELLKYRSPWVDGRIGLAFDSVEKRSTLFQRALLEMAYSHYPGRFTRQVNSLMNQSRNAKIFAMCAEYLLLTNKSSFAGINLTNKKKLLVQTEKDEAIISQLFVRLQNLSQKEKSVPMADIISQSFLQNHIILFSFQRKNRNYPGIALIRDSTGNFFRTENDSVFFVPQLARSISNLPGYLTNGNTPQGIFRMYGFDTSKNNFIGPTTNIQLTMPFETSLQHFFNDSTILDTVWTEDWYKKLLPVALQNYRPLFESYYAGKAGRNEIIAHGTTIDPAYYNAEIYYPQTPTMGCLCTKEIWSEADGIRLESDQQKLVNALLKAGGANGYCVVIELDDKPAPVAIHEISYLLNTVRQ